MALFVDPYAWLVEAVSCAIMLGAGFVFRARRRADEEHLQEIRRLDDLTFVEDLKYLERMSENASRGS